MKKAKSATKPRSDIIPLGSLKLNDRNPRTIDKDSFAKLCESIKAFPKMMAVRGIVVDKDGIVIGGTQRYRACVALGMTEIPAAWVKRAEDFTEAERQRFIIADNAPDGVSGSWDWDLLANDFDRNLLVEWGFKESQLGDDVAPPTGDGNSGSGEGGEGKDECKCPTCGNKHLREVATPA